MIKAIAPIGRTLAVLATISTAACRCRSPTSPIRTCQCAEVTAHGSAIMASTAMPIGFPPEFFDECVRGWRRAHACVPSRRLRRCRRALTAASCAARCRGCTCWQDACASVATASLNAPISFAERCSLSSAASHATPLLSAGRLRATVPQPGMPARRVQAAPSADIFDPVPGMPCTMAVVRANQPNSLRLPFTCADPRQSR